MDLAAPRPGLGRTGAARLLLALAAVVLAALLPNYRAVAEDLPAPDARVAAALALLEQSSAASDLPATLAANRVTVQFITMSPGIYARYSVARHVIEIDVRWSEADPATLAAVIAHESVHARDAVNGFLAAGGAEACVDSEIRAFRTSALFWTETFGPAGKPGAVDELERQLNLIADRQQRDPVGLEQIVRQAYVEQCSR